MVPHLLLVLLLHISKGNHYIFFFKSFFLHTCTGKNKLLVFRSGLHGSGENFVLKLSLPVLPPSEVAAQVN